MNTIRLFFKLTLLLIFVAQSAQAHTDWDEVIYWDLRVVDLEEALANRLGEPVIHIRSVERVNSSANAFYRSLDALSVGDSEPGKILFAERLVNFDFSGNHAECLVRFQSAGRLRNWVKVVEATYIVELNECYLSSGEELTKAYGSLEAGKEAISVRTYNSYDGDERLNWMK